MVPKWKLGKNTAIFRLAFMDVSTGRAHRRMRIPRSADERYTAPVNDPHAEYRASRSRKLVREFTVFVAVLSTVGCVALAVFWSFGLLGEVHWEEENAVASTIVFPDTLKQWNTLLQTTNRSVVLVVFSEGCPSCKRMKAPFLKTAQNMADYPVQFVGVNANKGEFGPLFHQYGVEVVPTILFLNPKRTIFPYPGGANADKIQKFVSDNLAKEAKR